MVICRIFLTPSKFARKCVSECEPQGLGPQSLLHLELSSLWSVSLPHVFEAYVSPHQMPTDHSVYNRNPHPPPPDSALLFCKAAVVLHSPTLCACLFLGCVSLSQNVRFIQAGTLFTSGSLAHNEILWSN